MLNVPTLQRWQRAAQRAVAADLPHQLRRRGGSVLVPSKSTKGTVYHVALSGERAGVCDCRAALNGKPCTHRAAIAIRLYERETGTRVVSVKPAAGLLIERYLHGEGKDQHGPRY